MRGCYCQVTSGGLIRSRNNIPQITCQISLDFYNVTMMSIVLKTTSSVVSIPVYRERELKVHSTALC
jgi:hypothetical protein